MRKKRTSELVIEQIGEMLKDFGTQGHDNILVIGGDDVGHGKIIRGKGYDIVNSLVNAMDMDDDFDALIRAAVECLDDIRAEERSKSRLS